VDKGQQFPEPKPKARRKLGYTSSEYGTTACNSCAKHIDLTDGDYQPIYNTDYQTGDAAFCSASCGKAIFGKKKDYS